MAYDSYDLQLDLRPFFQQRGAKAALARELGVTQATITQYLAQPPLSAATALAMRNEALLARLMVEPRPLLVLRQRQWKVPEPIERLDREFRLRSGGLQFSIAGGGTLRLQANERAPEPTEPTPSHERANVALEYLAHKLLLERNELQRDVDSKAKQLVQLESENAQLRTRLLDAERLAEEAIVKLPSTKEVPVPIAAVRDAERLFPSLSEALKQLPKN